MGFDYGDLPDMAVGTSGDANDPDTAADHRTTLSDNGPEHKISTNSADMVNLQLGAELED